MHHTKVKADIGVAKVITDLLEKGCVPCIPLSEHQPYDIVAVLDKSRIIKLQVKYAALTRKGAIEVKFRTSWADKNGTHIKRYGPKDFDYYAIYCPEKDKVFYVYNSPNCPKILRFDQTGNNQSKHVHWANDFLVLKTESSETIRHTSATTKT